MKVSKKTKKAADQFIRRIKTGVLKPIPDPTRRIINMSEKKTVEIEKHEMVQFVELEAEILALKEKYFEYAMQMQNTQDKVRNLLVQKIQHIQKIKAKYGLTADNLRLDDANNRIIEE